MESGKDLDALARCLSDFPVTGRSTWKMVSKRPVIMRANNAARHVSLEIIELKDRRRVNVFTRKARPLRDQEENLIKLCLR